MITKTRIGNHLRRHALGDQSTFRQGFKEGVEFVLKRTPQSKQEQGEPDYKTLAIQLQQQRTWVGLTMKEIEWCFTDANGGHLIAAKNIEALLKEKNT
jgi:hypothetical protein